MELTASAIFLKPPYQAILFVLLTPVVIFFSRPGSADRAWVIAGLLFIMYLLINSVALWFDNSPWWYFLYSIASTLGYIIIVSAIMPVLLNVMRLDGSGESGMIFLVLIYQPFALLLIMLAKWLVTRSS